MNDTDPLSEIVQSIYDAALDPAGWSPLAQRIARVFDTDMSQIHVRNSETGAVDILSMTKNYTESSLADYAAYYHRIDVHVDRASRKGFGEVFASDDIISSAEWIKSEIYTDFCRQLGFDQIAGSVIKCSPAETSVFSVLRGPGAARFSPGDKQRMARLVPHIQRSLQMRSRLAASEAQGRVGFNVMHAIKASLIVVDRDARILFANRSAETLLRRADGLYGISRILRGATLEGTALLHRLIAAAATVSGGGTNSPGGTVALPRRDGRPLSLTVCPLPQEAIPHGPTRALALIMVDDPDSRKVPAPEALAAVYGLTRAEARLFCALLEGERLQDYAERLGISVNTAKTQLGQIFQKTGQSRQTDLMREVWSNPAWQVLARE